MPQPQRPGRNDADWSLEDYKASNNLKRVWDQKAGELQLSQNKVAKRWGITQAAVSRYLNGVLRLNTETVLKFATSLDVEPEQIDPRITQFMRRKKNGYAATTMSLVVQNTHYEPRIFQGDWISLDTLNKVKPGKLTAAHHNDLLLIGYYDDKGILYHPLTRTEQAIPPNAFLHTITGIIPKENL